MKKQLFKTLTIAAMSLSLAACTGGQGNTKVSVESVEISETAITLAVGGTKQLTATVKPDNASNKAVQWSSSVNNVEVSAKGLVTAKSVGVSVVTVSALENGKSATCTVTVEEAQVDPKDAYEIDAPVRCIDSYVSYKTTIDPTAGHDDKTSFIDLEQGYAVGDANKINIKPSFSVYDKNDDEVDQDLWAYDFEFKFEVQDSTTKQFSLASTDDYSIVDARRADIKFASRAVGNTYRVTVYPGELTDEQKANPNYHAEYLFNVVEGYNVTEAKELSLLDTRHGVETDYHWGDVNPYADQWDAYKDAHGLDKTYEPSTLIFHKNIKVTSNDVPANIFYNAAEAQAAGLSIEGSLKDTAHIYSLEKPDTDVTIIGNYFQLDFSELPLIKRAEGQTGVLLNSHTAFFRVLEGTLTIKNLNVTGNAEKAIGSEYNKFAGGLMFTKSGRNASETKLYNVIAKSNFLTAFPEEYGDSSNISVTVEKSKFFDNYSSFLYNQGSTITAKDSIFRSCGGPIVVQDHTDVDTHSTAYEEHIEYGDFNYFKQNGRTPTTTFDHCTLDNYLLGEEAWFVQYGATEAVPLIKNLSDVFHTPTSGMMGYLVDADHNPVSSETTQDSLFNLIAVNKSGAAASITNYPVSGTVNIINSDDSVETFNYNKPSDEVTTIQRALLEQNAELITELCIKYQVASPEELAGVAYQLAIETGYEEDMYLHGGIRAMNELGAPVLQTGDGFGFYDYTGFWNVYETATQGPDVRVPVSASYYQNAGQYVGLYYSGMLIVFSLERATIN